MNQFNEYGFKNQVNLSSKKDLFLEELHHKGFVVIPDVIPMVVLVKAIEKINYVYSIQCSEVSYSLSQIEESNVVRCLFAYDDFFYNFLQNSLVVELISETIGSYFNLQLQNAIINVPNSVHHQNAWHRDLPYQNFTSSKPLAMNAIYCIHDFTSINGATEVLPFSHLMDNPPSTNYFNNNKEMILAKAGSLILMNSMLFHRAGVNQSDNIRMAINQVYTCGIIKPQIQMDKIFAEKNIIDPFLRMLFSLDNPNCFSVKEFRDQRLKRKKL